MIHQLNTTELFMLSMGAMLTGLYLLVKGGEWTVDSSVYIARKMGIPAEFIGFTIIAFGTSLPELIVSINANLSGFPGLSIGNVVGSNIANILLIFGVAMVFAPLSFKSKPGQRDLLAMLLATFLLILANYHGLIERWHGFAMFVALIIYVVYKFKSNKGQAAPVDDDEKVVFSHPILGWLFLLGGLIGVSLGSEFLVRGAVEVATVLNVPEAVIGLTIVAFGTSLPELSVAIQAARHGQNDILIGNVVGSNVFNILSILGITAFVKPLVIESSVLAFDIGFMAIISVALVFLAVLFTNLNRRVGVFALIMYVAYVALRYIS